MSREAAMSEPRSGEPIFFGAILNPVSDVFLASTNGMMAFFLCTGDVRAA